MTDAERQMLLDEEHLRLLRIGYLVLGTVSAVFALLPLLYVGMASLVVSSFANQAPRAGAPDPRMFVSLIVGFGIAACLFLFASAALKLLTARALRLRRHRTLCLITAGLTCLGIPYGTVLGIMTFSVLSRPSVLSMFDRLFPLPPGPGAASALPRA